MNIQYLREFIVFQNTLNFTASAKKLFISQPALSNHVAALENEIGVPLIKHGKSISLTSAGRKLASEAPTLIALHDGLLKDCREANVNGGTLCIARNHGTRSCNEDNFDILLAGFISAYPDIYIRDIAWDESSAYETIKNKDVDCVSVNYIPPKSDVKKGVEFTTTPNYTNGRFCLWLDESHPLAGSDTLVWSDVKSLRIPFSLNQSLVETNIIDLCEKLGIELDSRKTPEFGWSYLRSFGKDDALILDSGFENYETFRMFPERRLVKIAGPDSECLLHIGYLPTNDNPALVAFLGYIEKQSEGLSCTKDEQHV